MTSKRIIALLPVAEPKELYSSIPMRFSRHIVEKMPFFKRIVASVPLFFRKSSKSMPQTHVNIKNKTAVLYDNRHFSNVYEFGSSVFLRHMQKLRFVQAHHSHSTYFDNSSKIFYIAGKEGREGQDGTTVVRNIRENIYTEQKRVHTSESVKRIMSDTQYLTHHSRTKTINGESELTKLGVSKSYTPENLVYKLEKKVEEISEKLRKSIIHKSEEKSVTERLNIIKTLTKEDRIQQNREIQSLSEKVYSLVMKKYDRERRRRGDLYA